MTTVSLQEWKIIYPSDFWVEKEWEEACANRQKGQPGGQNHQCDLWCKNEGRQTDRRRFAFGGKGIRDKWTLVRTVTVSKAIRLSNTRGDNHARDLITNEWGICAQRSRCLGKKTQRGRPPYPPSPESPDGQEETGRSRRPIPSLLLSSSIFCFVGGQASETNPKPRTCTHTHPVKQVHSDGVKQQDRGITGEGDKPSVKREEWARLCVCQCLK